MIEQHCAQRCASACASAYMYRALSCVLSGVFMQSCDTCGAYARFLSMLYMHDEYVLSIDIMKSLRRTHVALAPCVNALCMHADCTR
jgi:hypothetical protein